jgi:hypothetical protein
MVYRSGTDFIRYKVTLVIIVSIPVCMYVYTHALFIYTHALYVIIVIVSSSN